MSARIQDVLQQAVSSGRFLGVSFIAVDKTGNTIFSGSKGRRRFDSDEPMTISTSGWIASMTKLMTAVSIMHLVQTGLVTLDEDVAHLLPELRNKEVLTSYDIDTKVAKFESLTDKITLRRLLTHSSGFLYPSSSEVLNSWAKDNNRTMEKFTGDFKTDWDRPMVFQPGQSWGYGQGLDWAGKVLEKISGKSLGAYMEEHMWLPLGMRDTTFHPEKRDSYPMLEMGKRPNGPGSVLETGDGHHYPIPAVNESGGGGLFSNADDYIKLLAALLSDDNQLLTKESIEELVRPQLNDLGREGLKREREKWVLPEIPKHVQVDHALGGIVTSENVPGGRPKGAMAWDGYTNSNWLLDRVSGIAMVCITQVIPGDPDSKKLWSDLENAVYSSVRGSKE